MAAGPAAAAAARIVAKKALIPGAIAAGTWALNKFAAKAADDTYDGVKDKAAKGAADKQQRELAEDLARIRKWRYTQHVVDGERRYVVFDDDKQPVAAFPPVQDHKTPEKLAACPELRGYVPSDEELNTPAPAFKPS